jgi:sortase A
VVVNAPGRRVPWLALGLLAIGASLTGRSAYLGAKALLAAHLIRQAWSRTLETGTPQPPWSWADTHPIGRLMIPRLGYDEIILEGACPRNLAFGPARLMNGVRPGEPGNLILAGHRTSWFRSLQDVARGDLVWLEWRDGATGTGRRRAYRVAEIRIVDPDDVALLAPTGNDVVTLITCYPFGPSPRSPQRYVVRAEALGDAIT